MKEEILCPARLGDRRGDKERDLNRGRTTLDIKFEVRHSGKIAFLRGTVPESFPWPSVKLFSDGVALVLCERGHAGAFG